MALEINLGEPNAYKFINFFKFYDFESIISNTEEKYHLGEKLNPRVCRFCRKYEPEVKFTSDAHVIPVFMGNKILLPFFECDNCNNLFSAYADSFANMFGITRTCSQVRGKSNKVPKFKDKKTGLEVILTDSAIQMSTTEGINPISFDLKEKKLIISTERPGYIPIHIPKAIMKIGLSMLSAEDVSDYEVARKFIFQKEKDSYFKDNVLLRLFGHLIPGPPKFSKPFVQLFKKKEDYKDELLPARHIVLYYSNYIFQMVLPFANSDDSL